MSSKQVKKKSAATTRKPAKTTAKKKATKKVEPKAPKPADAKPTAPSKVFDVSKPGQSMPSATTRPVIVTRRPMARDPMVAPVQKASATTEPAEDSKPAEEPAAFTARVKKNRIEPLSSDLKSDSKAADTSPAAEAGKDKNAFSVPLDAKPSIQLVKDTAPEDSKSDTQPGEEASQPPAEEKPEEAAVPEAADDEDKSEEKAAEEPASTDEPAEDDESEQDAANDEEKADTQEGTDDSAKTEDKNDGDMDEVTELAGQAAAKKAQKNAEDEAAKRLAAAEALVDKQTYYVPVNAVHKRKTVHAFMVIFVLIVVLAGAVAAIDAGLLDVGVELPFNLLPDDLLQ